MIARLTTAMMLVLSAPAWAFDAADALPCLNYLPTHMGIGAEAEIAALAVQDCGPFKPRF